MEVSPSSKSYRALQDIQGTQTESLYNVVYRLKINIVAYVAQYFVLSDGSVSALEAKPIIKAKVDRSTLATEASPPSFTLEGRHLKAQLEDASCAGKGAVNALHA
jgi:hypothetical protein